MAEFTAHLPGTFSWPELATTDQAAAVTFYRGLFGWGVNEQPLGPGEVYTMFTVRGLDIGAAYSMRPDERQMGIPPHWNAYVTVNNVDETAARAADLGGVVLAPPFDVMDAGRMAVIQDPTGAVFQIWQRNKSIGAKILNEPGALCWTELTTTDPAKAEEFYTGLFEWTPKHSAPGVPMPYTEFHNQGQPGIGMMGMPAGMPAMPSYWMPYFMVDGCDASVATATGLGAQVIVPPTDIPSMGRFSVLSDPQGAVFAVFAVGR